MGFAPPMSLADFSREALQTMHQQVLGHSAGVLAALVLLAVLGSGWVVFSTRLSADAPLQRFARAVLWLAALALVYTLLHMGSMWRSRIVSVRHFIFLLPLLYLLAGCGVYYLHRLWRPGAWAVLLAACALQWPTVARFAATQKNDFRAAAAFISQSLTAEPRLVWAGFMLNPAGYDFYFGRHAPRPMRLVVVYDPEDWPLLCDATRDLQDFAVIRLAHFPRISEQLHQHCSHHELAQTQSYVLVVAEIWRKRENTPNQESHKDP